jgi:uncharacterized membrane protein YkoI
MKTPHYAALATVLLPAVLSWAPVPTGAEVPRPIPVLVDEDEMDVRDAVAHAKISLVDAIQKALAAQPGRAVEAELEGEADDGEVEVSFEVLILTAGGELVEVEIDAADGSVLEQEEAEDEEDELPGIRAALRHSEHDLLTLVEKAAGYVKGIAVEAELEFDDGQPVCEVAFVNTRFVIEVEVEGRAGHLLEIEVRAEDAEGEDEYEDEGEEEDEEGQEETVVEEEIVEEEIVVETPVHHHGHR